MNRSRHTHRSRGLVILVVMVVVTLSALIGSSVLLMSDAAASSSVHDRRATQSRLAAWSGMQAVMSRLHDQRDDLLMGSAPVLPEVWTFPIEDGSGSIGFQLVGRRGLLLAESENAKLDVNLASVEMLAALPMIDESLAQRLVSARPFGSVAELERVEGISPTLLYGSGTAGGDTSELQVEGELDAPLVSVLTVFSFDPNVQLGAGENGEAHQGKRRINLGLGWSEGLSRAVADRWDESAAAFLQTLFEQGEQLTRTSEVVALYRRYGAAPEAWIEGLDALTTIESEHVRGLVDINRAPAMVLAALPGIDEDKARAVVDARERLGLDQRTSIVWPVIEGILSQSEFEQACDWMTTRSMQWRVRVEGGSFAAEDEDRDPLEESGPLRDRVVLEGVIDVSSRRPRVASIRDVTGLQLALNLGASGDDDETGPEFESVAFDEVSNPELNTEDPASSADAASESAGEPTDEAWSGGRIGRWTGAGGAAP